MNLANGAVSSWNIPTATITDGEAFSFTNSVILVTLLMQLEQTALYIHQVLLVVTVEMPNQEPLIVDTVSLSQVLLKVLVQV